ncbi:MAG: phenylalanine--tRNA ligase subunit beta, partial [candidate division Zixibacteria bacterium CG_4_9_14_3_um_filter_46_8]
MKISYNWLKAIMPFEWSVTELAERLTMSGTEVESIEKIGGISDQVVIAEVKTVRKHPNADKLTVCEVFDGSTTSQVVCGAPNVAEGQKVLFAKIGAQLPNGITIKKSKLRGIDSFGMICSYAELNLGEDKSGIAVLSPQSIVGMKAEEFFGRSDFILELEITPNRPDCLSHRGIARELQALGGGQLRSPETRLIESGPRTDDEISIEIANPDDCPRYAARLIRNVEVKPSPTWLVERLRGLGIRAINNIVDVTNFVMMEYGQPLHAFDFGLFSHKKIIVRGAKDGEKFTTLDRVDRKLPAGAILITDGIKPVALGGIMGGLNSEVSNITSGVLLEAAYFNPVTIRKTAKSVGLSTESSQRFERGADYEGLIVALDRAAQLINELAGGTIDIGSADCYPLKFQDKTITLRASQVNNLLGTTLSLDGMLRILNSLDIETTTTSQDSLKCIVPSFRPDLNRPVDLIEEIARIYGLGNIASSETL